MSENKELFSRSYKCEVRSSDEENSGYKILGRPIVYNSPADIGGMFTEYIDDGALDHADLKDVRFLVNHNINEIPLARSRNNNANSTMKLTVNSRGLDIEVDLDCDNNMRAKELYSAVKRGDITGMSFLFSVNKDEWSDLKTDHPTRHIKEIGKVVEVSAVSSPAYEATSISARDKNALDNAKFELESSRKKSLESELELAKAKALAETKIF